MIPGRCGKKGRAEMSALEMIRGTAIIFVAVAMIGCSERKPAELRSAKEAHPAAEDVGSRTIERRAIEAVIWGMPAVNYDLMYQAMVSETHGDFNQIVYWSKLPSWKNQTLTPNPDAIYIMAFISTKEVGPVVLEIPPASRGTIVGSIDDAWQTAIEDVGPAGFDKGRGGKYLILPPGYKGQPPAGYFPMQSSTFQSYALLRSILKSGSDTDVASAVAYGKRIKVYPLSQASHPTETKWNDALEVVFDSTIPYDLRFFQSLNRIVQYEPWLERDKAMIDALNSIGIEKGKPFNPDSNSQGALKNAAIEAHTWLDTSYEAVFVPSFNPGIQWALPASTELVQGLQTNYADPNLYPTDARGLAYSYAFFSAKHLGTGQYYLMTIKDKNGERLNGSSAYKLTVPPNAPVNQYWSATVYNGDTHAFIRNAQRLSRSSQNPDLQKNSDGSVDIYFAPNAPNGKDSNWVPTDPSRKFEVLFRLYGPEKPLFDKTWKLPDIEKMQ
jgi:hypothetical protein